MMKLKFIALAVCSLLCVGTAYAAVNTATKDAQYVAAAETTVDISAGATVAWGASAELKQLTISFDKAALPDFNYDAMDKDTYKYVQEYLYFNGKSVKEINEELFAQSVTWTYTQFPGNSGNDIYKVPVLIYEREATRLRLFIHENYFAMLGENPTFEIKEGLSFVNEGTTYVMQGSRLFTFNGSSWDATQAEKPKVETDVTENVTITGWDVTGNASELTYTRINLGAGVVPEGIGYGIIDAGEWKYIQEYITINGRTVADINANVDDSAYVYSTFPSTADAKYKVPVMIYVNGETLEVKVHNDYITSLGGNIDVVIGVKAGLTVENGENLYKVSQDVEVQVREKVVPTYTVTFMANDEVVGTVTYKQDATSIDEPAVPEKKGYTGAWESYTLSNSDVVVNAVYTPFPESDITENVTITGWDVTGDASELTYTRINLGEGVVPEGVGYGIIDADAWKYIQEYITINGRTVADINTNVDDSAYVYSTFPSTMDAYKVPVIVFVNNGKLEIKVHNDYIATLGDADSIIIGVKAGLSIIGEGVTYKVMEDVAVTVREYVNIEESVTINGWDVTGDASELTYTRINLGEGVIPAGVGYGIIDADAWKYIQEYITINGRTVADINANVDDSTYVYSTFPSTMDAYKVPVMIYVNDGTLEVKVHNDYVATLGDNIDVIIGVKTGLSIQNDVTIYTVEEDVEVYTKRKKYTLTVEYAPGEVYEYSLTMGAEITLGEAQREHYTFVGWFEKDTDNQALTVMPESDYAICAKYVANEYTVTFMASGEQVGEAQTYTVENVEITVPDVPEKQHYTASWDSYQLNGGDIVVEAVYTAIEYTVTFMNGETVVATATYTVDDATIAEPQAPTKEGYTSVWAPYELNGGNVEVDVIYTVIEYTVTFMDGETVVGTATYTVENTEITEPDVPTKEGYTSVWASYELTGGDITVEVIYTAIEDSSSEDSSSEDSSVEDSSVEDSSVDDSSVEDSSVEDSSVEDSSVEDSSVEDSSVEDSSVEDSSVEDSSVEDSSVEDSSVEDSSVEDSSSEDSTVVESSTADSSSKASSIAESSSASNASNNDLSSASSNNQIAPIGCFGSVGLSSIGLLVAALSVVVLLRKKENE